MGEERSERWAGWLHREQDDLIEIADPIPTDYAELTKMLFEGRSYTPMTSRAPVEGRSYTPMTSRAPVEGRSYTPMTYGSIPISAKFFAGIFGGILFLALLLRLINSLKELIS